MLYRLCCTCSEFLSGLCACFSNHECLPPQHNSERINYVSTELQHWSVKWYIHVLIITVRGGPQCLSEIHRWGGQSEKGKDYLQVSSVYTYMLFVRGCRSINLESIEIYIFRNLWRNCKKWWKNQNENTPLSQSTWRTGSRKAIRSKHKKKCCWNNSSRIHDRLWKSAKAWCRKFTCLENNSENT